MKKTNRKEVTFNLIRDEIFRKMEIVFEEVFKEVHKHPTSDEVLRRLVHFPSRLHEKDKASLLVEMKKQTIAIDFDGTCVTHSFPYIGKDIGAIPVLRRLVESGHKLILWTMRCDKQKEQTFADGYKIHGGDFLKQAVRWFKKNDIELYDIQRNKTQDSWTSSPKCYAQLYIDDAALGCPLIQEEGEKPYVDWVEVEKILERKGYFSGK